MKAASLPPTIWMFSDQRVVSCRKVGSGSLATDPVCWRDFRLAPDTGHSDASL